MKNTNEQIERVRNRIMEVQRLATERGSITYKDLAEIGGDARYQKPILSYLLKYGALHMRREGRKTIYYRIPGDISIWYTTDEGILDIIGEAKSCKKKAVTTTPIDEDLDIIELIDEGFSQEIPDIREMNQQDRERWAIDYLKKQGFTISKIY